MPSRPFAQVDVFTGTPCLSNPVAVVLDGRGLDTATMQRFTDWTNLSEATFVLPPTKPGADYALRIFCPGRELPFAVSRVGVIRPPRVGIYRPALPVPKGVSNDPIEELILMR